MKVLFVCYANAGRSQTAKALYNLFTATDNAHGAGTNVANYFPEGKTIGEYEKISGHVSRTRSYLKNNFDIDIVNSSRVHMTSDLISRHDLVVNIAERWQTPDWLRGENVIWWDVPDLLPGDSGDSTFIEVEKRVRELIELEKSRGNFRELDDNIDKEANNG